MGQVPASTSYLSYLVVGDGRLARHFSHYLNLESISFATWSRRANSQDDLTAKASAATHVLLAISDSSLESFAREHASELSGKTLVHFSGALTISGVVGVHPLMTFSHTLYDRETYRKIPFVLERNSTTWNDLFPRLQNPNFTIATEQKSLYHALCVLSGNGTVLLWEKAQREFSQRLGLPPEILNPYLQQVTRNLCERAVRSNGLAHTNPTTPRDSVLTGPIARGDVKTIEKNLASLEGDPFAAVYRALVLAHQNEQEARHEIRA